MMHVQNPTSQSRLCPSLGENLEAFEVREVADGFVRCEECRCILSGEAVVDVAAPEDHEDRER